MRADYAADLEAARAAAEMDAAATTVQRVARGRLAKSQLQARRSAQREERAVIVLQAAERGRSARQSVLGMVYLMFALVHSAHFSKVERERAEKAAQEKELELEARNRAALQIQVYINRRFNNCFKSLCRRCSEAGTLVVL